MYLKEIYQISNQLISLKSFINTEITNISHASFQSKISLHFFFFFTTSCKPHLRNIMNIFQKGISTRPQQGTAYTKTRYVVEMQTLIQSLAFKTCLVHSQVHITTPFAIRQCSWRSSYAASIALHLYIIVMILYEVHSLITTQFTDVIIVAPNTTSERG